jgi:hypothetical protein
VTFEVTCSDNNKKKFGTNLLRTSCIENFYDEAAEEQQPLQRPSSEEEGRSVRSFARNFVPQLLQT